MFEKFGVYPDRVIDVQVTLLNALERYDLKRGVAAVCIGGGEGTAIAIELPENTFWASLHLV